jgi:hypothetical protein
MKGIEDALSSDVAGAIVLAQRMTKAGISASVVSATLHQLGEIFMKLMAISSLNTRLTIGS